ncbi:caspase [Penicillium malachiteum]|uniref:caspase n=1 Tax=Penicillium malachiteum TaxID=1324776 RepID=UPI0025477E5C|nr:caspase [Penicillium malachiteum]KAJ5720226.1 caspase [Penicillium malachiteum]
MINENTVVKHYAILIGVDAYLSGPLTSCVRDIQMIQKCLEDKLGSVEHTLIASKSPDPEIITPLEDPERWPTCYNVTSVFERVTSQAKPKDYVYIHYSGHGTRLPPCFDLSNQSTGDLALVLLEGDQSPEIFLRGPRLARLLKEMVDKGLVLTLVLDCCFSATVYRNNGPGVRYLPYGLVAASTHSLDPKDIHIERSTHPTNRDVSMRDNWLLEPERYAILAACGPDENAKGGSEKGLTYRALSYFLSRTLSDHGLGRKHKEIYRHIRAMFWDSSMVQHLVLYGNGGQSFFNPLKSHRGVRSIYIIKREGSLQLLAGEAHGLHDGDQFTVSPSGWTSGNGAKENYIAKSHVPRL